MVIRDVKNYFMGSSTDKHWETLA